MNNFYRMNLLPQYIFNSLDEMKVQARQRGDDIIDFGMGNPDQPTPAPIVEALIESAQNAQNHRYSMSKGIHTLREAICNWYQRQYNVTLNPETQAIVTIGSKEGIGHLALAIISPGDTVLVPSPAYPIHKYAFIIAGAQVQHIELGTQQEELLQNIKHSLESIRPLPKMLVLNFPCNPTTQCVELGFFEEVVSLAKKYGVWLLHDLAYADIVFEGYKAPSILQVKGAHEIAVECYTLSKSYNMPGWRVGFMCGNTTLIAALTRMKSYLDYGMFAPIQHAAAVALNSGEKWVKTICEVYRQRRDTLCTGLAQCNWNVAVPKASMFVWAKIPEQYQTLGSLKFAQLLLSEASVAVSPGIGFGPYGNNFVRFSLIEDEQRIQQAIKNLRPLFQNDQVISA